MFVTIIVVLILLALALYATNYIPAADPTLVRLIQLVMVLAAIFYIARAAGLL